MLRAIFPCAFALGAIAANTSQAADLPVIINGTQVVQAPKAEQAPPPAKSNTQLPKIANYPSDLNLPVVKQAKGLTRVVVPLDIAAASDDVAPVTYNAYCWGPMLGLYGGPGYGLYAPWSGAYGYSSAYGGYCGGYGYYGCGPGLAYSTAIVDLRPPKVEILDTGVRANIGRLTSLPSVGEPVYGDVLGVYYRR
jgi:hypothetical protein